MFQLLNVMDQFVANHANCIVLLLLSFIKYVYPCCSCPTLQSFIDIPMLSLRHYMQALSNFVRTKEIRTVLATCTYELYTTIDFILLLN